MNHLLIQVIAAIVATATGFTFHVVTSERLHSWISAQMQGRNVSSSRKVLVPAALTSLESGLGLVIFYALVRDHLPFNSAILRGVTVGFLILAITGKLFRQPFMNWLIGNPIKVVVVQDGVTWVNWLLMSTVLAIVYEVLIH